MKSRAAHFFSVTAVVSLIMAAVASCVHKPESTVPALPDTVSFQQDIIPLFSANCLGSGCHSGASPAAHLDLTADSAYAQLFRKKDVDTTVAAAQNFLYQTMNSTATPMPPSGRLSDYDVNLVLKWIQQGVRNN